MTDLVIGKDIVDDVSASLVEAGVFGEAAAVKAPVFENTVRRRRRGLRQELRPFDRPCKDP
ncbi:MAG: hypothetical protein CME05_02020 [Gemmatimonadaceae bacterium]|nr:hypothetical protein [Gemmatimonadaceae bacterium]|tara:strand:+ start:343 stop:525 length:183 start_codon:yes stop_codon:yes gene_type:complete